MCTHTHTHTHTHTQEEEPPELEDSPPAPTQPSSEAEQHPGTSSDPTPPPPTTKRVFVTEITDSRDTGADLPEIPLITPQQEKEEVERDIDAGSGLFSSTSQRQPDRYSTSLLMELTRSGPGTGVGPPPASRAPSGPLIEEVSSIGKRPESPGVPPSSQSLIEELDSDVNSGDEKEPLLPAVSAEPPVEPGVFESQETAKGTLLPSPALTGNVTRVKIEFVSSAESQHQTRAPQPPSEEATDSLDFEAAARMDRGLLPVSARELEREGETPQERKSVRLSVESQEIIPTLNSEPDAEFTGGEITSTSTSWADSRSPVPDLGSGMEPDTLGTGTDALIEEESSSALAGPKPGSVETKPLELLSSYSPPESGSDEPLGGGGGGGGESGHWATPMKKPLIEEITSPTEQKRAQQDSDLVLEDLECDDDLLNQVEPSSENKPSASPSGLRLADVPNITDEAEFRRVEAAFERINRSPASELSVEDKIWLVAARGGSTLKDEGVELDSESRQRVRKRLKEADVVDKVSLAF